MSDLLLTLFFVFIILMIVFALVLSLDYVIEKLKCSAKTGEMIYNSRYSLIGGCLIEIEEGNWIPLDNYYFRED